MHFSEIKITTYNAQQWLQLVMFFYSRKRSMIVTQKKHKILWLSINLSLKYKIPINFTHCWISCAVILISMSLSIKKKKTKKLRLFQILQSLNIYLVLLYNIKRPYYLFLIKIKYLSTLMISHIISPTKPSINILNNRQKTKSKNTNLANTNNCQRHRLSLNNRTPP